VNLGRSNPSNSGLALTETIKPFPSFTTGARCYVQAYAKSTALSVGSYYSPVTKFLNELGDFQLKLNKGVKMQKPTIRKSIIFGSVVLIGCVTGCNQLSTEKKHIAECEAKRLSGELKTHVAVIDCARDDIISTYKWGSFNGEIAEQKVSYKRLVASKLDDKKITEDEATLLNLQIDQTYADKIDRKNQALSQSLNNAALTNALVNDLNEPTKNTTLNCTSWNSGSHGRINCN